MTPSGNRMQIPLLHRDRKLAQAVDKATNVTLRSGKRAFLLSPYQEFFAGLFQRKRKVF